MGLNHCHLYVSKSLIMYFFLYRWPTWLQSILQKSLKSLSCLMRINKEASWGLKVTFTVLIYIFIFTFPILSFPHCKHWTRYTYYYLRDVSPVVLFIFFEQKICCVCWWLYVLWSIIYVRGAAGLHSRTSFINPLFTPFRQCYQTAWYLISLLRRWYFAVLVLQTIRLS